MKNWRCFFFGFFFFFWETHFVHFRLYCWRAAVAVGRVCKHSGPTQLFNSLSTRIRAETTRVYHLSSIDPLDVRSRRRNDQRLISTSWISERFLKHQLVPPLFCFLSPGFAELLLFFNLKRQLKSHHFSVFARVPKFPESVLLGFILLSVSFCFLVFQRALSPNTVTDWFSSGGTVTAWSSSRIIWWYVAF